MGHHDLLQASASYPEISVTLSETGREFFLFFIFLIRGARILLVPHGLSQHAWS